MPSISMPETCPLVQRMVVVDGIASRATMVPLEIVMIVRLVQPLNALYPIFVTLSGIVILNKLVQY